MKEAVFASLALLGGTIYPSPTAEPIRDGVVLVVGDRITAVGPRASVRLPPEATKLDCTGLTVTAAFWNSHVHFFERKWAKAEEIPATELQAQLAQVFARYGFATVFDLGSMWDNTKKIRDRVESGEVAGPRIRATGDALVRPGTVPSADVLNILGTMPRETPRPKIENAEQATSFTRGLIDAGVDGIKLHSISDTAILAAAVAEAHRAGKPVFVHPAADRDGLIAAIRSGVDVLAHTTPWSGAWDPGVVKEMLDRRVAVIPTLTIWAYLQRHDRLSAQQQTKATTFGQLRAWLAAGGTVLFGTDAGAVPDDPSDEYALMAEAGLSFRDILASLTTAPAQQFGDKDAGRLAPGLRADLVVLQADPARDVRALATVQYTLRAGKVVYRANEPATSPPRPR